MRFSLFVRSCCFKNGKWHNLPISFHLSLAMTCDLLFLVFVLFSPLCAAHVVRCLYFSHLVAPRLSRHCHCIVFLQLFLLLFWYSNQKQEKKIYNACDWAQNFYKTMELQHFIVKFTHTVTLTLKQVAFVRATEQS